MWTFYDFDGYFPAGYINLNAANLKDSKSLRNPLTATTILDHISLRKIYVECRVDISSVLTFDFICTKTAQNGTTNCIE